MSQAKRPAPRAEASSIAPVSSANSTTPRRISAMCSRTTFARTTVGTFVILSGATFRNDPPYG